MARIRLYCRQYGVLSLSRALVGLLLGGGCGGLGNTPPRISCGAGTHEVNNICEEDPAFAIATGAGSYWRGSLPLGNQGTNLYFQFSSASTGGSGLCTFTDANAVEPPNALRPGSTCTTPMNANALTMLSNIIPNQIPTPTSFTANVTSSFGTQPVMFTLLSGDPGATTYGVMPQGITWAEGTVSTSITINGCPYFGQTTCAVTSN